MKKAILSVLVMMMVVVCAGTAHAITFDQGYQYTFKFTNWEFATSLTSLTDEAGNPVPSTIQGYYTITTIQRATAEIIGGVLVVNPAKVLWWTPGTANEWLDGTFTLAHTAGVDGGTQSYSALFDLWIDDAAENSASAVTAAATFGGPGTGGDGDSLLATLASNFYDVSVDDFGMAGGYDGIGGNNDYNVSAGLAFTSDFTGLDWLDIPGPVSGFYQLGLTASLFIVNPALGFDWDVISDDPLIGTAPVPEPASMLLVGMGLVGGFLRKRKTL